MTPAAVEACASALDAWPCVNQGPPEACYFFGALSGGAACNEGLQCQSGQCQGTAAFSPDGQIGPSTCGTCAPVVAIGQDCGNAGCPAGAICMTSDPSAKQPTYTCTAVTQGGPRASCNDLSAVCGPGLYCSTQGTCAGLEDAGAACSLDPSTCAPPLNCVGPSSTASCALLGDGGLGEGTYPALVPDGQPCSSGGLFGSGPTCDNFAECFTPVGPAGMTGAMGTCTLMDSTVCK